jgi:hypothetical protein
MAIRWLMGGGQMFATTGPFPVGGYTGAGFTINSAVTTPAVGDGYAFASSSGNAESLHTPALGTSAFTGLIAGMRNNISSLVNTSQLIVFADAAGNQQCDVRMNAAGQLYFTRAGTVISSASGFALTTSSWFYIEFKALFSNTGTGTCEVRINGGTVLTATGLTNAVTANGGMSAYFCCSAGGPFYLRDFYVLDTGSGVNTSYLGDINVIELYPDGAGANATWATNIGPLAGTAVALASGGSTVYTYTTLGLATSALVGYNFVTSGFAHSANNGTFTCTASTATTVTLNNAAGVVDTTGSIAFQNPVQIGINKTGTRPNGDVVYMLDSTAGNITDFAHTPLTLTGSILGVCQWSFLRKDDAGSRSVAQVCLSGTASEQGTTVSLGNTYQYYPNILEVDPNTSTAFTVSGLNAATFGMKEIS